MEMTVEIDPGTTFTGIGGITGLSYILYLLRKLRRSDSKETVVEGTWHGIIGGMNAEITRLHQLMREMEGSFSERIGRIQEQVSRCEGEKTKLQIELDTFKRSMGTRTEGGAT